MVAFIRKMKFRNQTETFATQKVTIKPPNADENVETA